MDKQILNFTVNEQNLNCENPIRISTNKVNYIQANFDLGTNWSGFDSVRAVWFNDFNCISTVLDSLGNCAVPFEVMKRKGNVKVNLVGSISEDDVLTDRLTSYPVVAVIVDCTAQINGANTSPITPSEYEQFVAAVHEDAERAEAGATASEQSAQNASDSATSAHNSAQSAHDDKIAIEQAIAEVIQQIEDFEQVQVVVNTLPPSSQATSDFTDGVLTLGIPQGVKGDTGNGIQSITKVSTSGLVDTYRITYTNGQTTTFTVTNGAKGDTGNGIQSIAKTSTVGLVDTYTITYTNGNTTTFTVTNGEKGDKGDTGEVSLSQLEDATVVQTLSDNTPYNYRRTNNGNGSGTREYDEIVGASVAWNQIFDSTGLATSTESGVTYTKVSDYEWNISGNATAQNTKSIMVASRLIADHVYAITNFNNFNGQLKYSFGASYYGADTIAKWSGAQNLRLIHTPSASFSNATLKLMVIDLTLALGSTIADYVYTLETATAGSGVTWLKTNFPKLFDNGYQSYNAGSIKSVSGLTAHEMVGVNQWDEEWLNGRYRSGVFQVEASYFASKNPIPILPDTSYYIGSSVNTPLSLTFYDANMTWMQGRGQQITNNVFTTPNGAHYMVFNTETTAYGTTYKNDICINLSDASKNGTYEQYQKHSYPLDSTITLRGIPKLDASNNLYYDGDTYESDGTVTRKYAEVDLGTLNWTYTTNRAFAQIPSRKPINGDDIVGAVTQNGYTQLKPNSSLSVNGQFAIINATSNLVFFYDGTHAPSGLMTYELATPTTESAEPYTNPQTCDPNGTEEYVTTSIVPIGHNTDYPMSLVDTMPTTNGTFEPRVTVTNGVRTVTWVSV